MSNNNLDSVETTLKELMDIVQKNHSERPETAQIVLQMERLVLEMKDKSKVQNFAVDVNAVASSVMV